jgi:hypothetical protein
MNDKVLGAWRYQNQHILIASATIFTIGAAINIVVFLTTIIGIIIIGIAISIVASS